VYIIVRASAPDTRYLNTYMCLYLYAHACAVRMCRCKHHRFKRPIGTTIDGLSLEELPTLEDMHICDAEHESQTTVYKHHKTKLQPDNHQRLPKSSWTINLHAETCLGILCACCMFYPYMLDRSAITNTAIPFLVTQYFWQTTSSTCIQMVCLKISRIG
jgi:hypothetical protein